MDTPSEDEGKVGPLLLFGKHCLSRPEAEGYDKPLVGDEDITRGKDVNKDVDKEDASCPTKNTFFPKLFPKATHPRILITCDRRGKAASVDRCDCRATTAVRADAVIMACMERALSLFLVMPCTLPRANSCDVAVNAWDDER